MVDGSATEHQVSDGVGVGIGAAPADGGTFIGAHPDHAGLTPELSDAVGVVDRLCPPATVLIEVVPVGGLNGEGHLGSFAVVCIVADRGVSPTIRYGC